MATAVSERGRAAGRVIEFWGIGRLASTGTNRHADFSGRLTGAAVTFAFISIPVRPLLGRGRDLSRWTSPGRPGEDRLTGATRHRKASTDAAKASAPYWHGRPSIVMLLPHSGVSLENHRSACVFIQVTVDAFLDQPGVALRVHRLSRPVSGLDG